MSTAFNADNVIFNSLTPARWVTQEFRNTPTNAIDAMIEEHLGHEYLVALKQLGAAYIEEAQSNREAAEMHLIEKVQPIWQQTIRNRIEQVRKEEISLQ